jgi:hypothetical protein
MASGQENIRIVYTGAETPEPRVRRERLVTEQGNRFATPRIEGESMARMPVTRERTAGMRTVITPDGVFIENRAA